MVLSCESEASKAASAFIISRPDMRKRFAREDMVPDNYMALFPVFGSEHIADRET